MYEYHDPRNSREIMAPDGSKVTILLIVVRLLPSALMSRSLVRVVKILLPDGSNATILATVVTFLHPGWIQCHDPRNSRQIMALWLSIWIQRHDPCNGRQIMVLWLSGWTQGRDPRNYREIMALRFDATIARKGRQTMALRMDPMPRSS